MAFERHVGGGVVFSAQRLMGGGLPDHKGGEVLGTGSETVGWPRACSERTSSTFNNLGSS